MKDLPNLYCEEIEEATTMKLHFSGNNIYSLYFNCGFQLSFGAVFNANSLTELKEYAGMHGIKIQVLDINTQQLVTFKLNIHLFKHIKRLISSKELEQ